MSSLGSSLEPIEDRFSIVLSRLERIEASLSGLEDVKKLLMQIEDNTHPDDDGKSDFRHNWQEKVCLQNIPFNNRLLIEIACFMNRALPYERKFGKMSTYDRCSYKEYSDSKQCKRGNLKN